MTSRHLVGVSGLRVAHKVLELGHFPRLKCFLGGEKLEDSGLSPTPSAGLHMGKRPKLLNKNGKKLWSYSLIHYDNAAPCSYGNFTSLAIN